MRSNDSSEGRRARLVAVGLAIVAAVAIGYLRPRLAAEFHRLKVTSDVYPLPDPDKTVVLSLGWRSALADLIYAHVLVSSGIHLQEKRRFEFAGNYVDTVTRLDPKFRTPYRFVDTVLVLGATAPRESDFDKARELFERGMDELPYDQELWNAAGQFMAYFAPPNFKDEAKKREWRLAGARRMARACELVGKNDKIPFHCITAAGIFTRAGEREATIDFLQRVLVITDNEEIRRMALDWLEKVLGERERDETARRAEAFNSVWRNDLTFFSKPGLLVIGPPFDPARCAGKAERDGIECASTWRSWGEELERR